MTSQPNSGKVYAWLLSNVTTFSEIFYYSMGRLLWRHVWGHYGNQSRSDFSEFVLPVRKLSSMEKEQLIMSEYSEICISCGQAYLNNVLKTIDMNHWEFINIFIQNSDDVFTSTLKICMLCCEKLGQFKVFFWKVQE